MPVLSAVHEPVCQMFVVGAGWLLASVCFCKPSKHLPQLFGFEASNLCISVLSAHARKASMQSGIRTVTPLHLLSLLVLLSQIE